MNPAKLKELVISPENVEEKDFPELLALLSKYPYFQAASILAAKAKNSSEFIKSAAVRTANRGVLRQIISGEFDQDVSLHNIDELDIHSGINAFEKLANEETTSQEELESTFSDEIIPDQPAIENEENETVEEPEEDESSEITLKEELSAPEEEAEALYIGETEKNILDSGLDEVIEENTEEEIAKESDNKNPILKQEEEEIEKAESDEDFLPDFKEASFDSEEELSSMSFEAPDYQFDLDSETSTTSLEEEDILENEEQLSEKETESDEDENHFNPDIDLPIEEENIINTSKEELEESIKDADESDADLNESFVVKDIINEPDIDAEVKDLIEDDSFRNDLMDSLNDLQNTRKALAEEEKEQMLNKSVSNEEGAEDQETDPFPENKETENSSINDEVFESEYQEIFKSIPSEEADENMEEKAPETGTLKSENLTGEDVESEEENDTFADADLFDLNYLLGDDENQSGKEKKKMRIETTERQKEIIDKFIEEVPQISIQGGDERTQSEFAKELYNKSVSEDLSIMTERMAILFSQQGKNGKAIEIYEQLILKYPEKKTYFATLIENLRNEQ